MNKKLRLVITAKCPNKCPMCCNNRFDLNEIPVFDRVNYEEISITGGEPLLFPYEVEKICTSIRSAAELQGYKPKIWLYTAKLDPLTFDLIANVVDGMCYTPHSAADVADFKGVNRHLLRNKENLSAHFLNNFSLRLNIFKPEAELLKDEDLSLWRVKPMEWIKDCPIPEGEDFRRIAKLL